jgi:hypothetical protein
MTSIGRRLSRALTALALTLLAPRVAAAAGYDVIVYRATSAGVIAAVEAARHGLKVLVVEPGQWAGGMTASGLGVTDIGYIPTISGLSRVFYQTVCHEYYTTASAALSACLKLHNEDARPPFKFEPHVAAAAFQAMLAAPPQGANITVLYRSVIVSLQKTGATIISATLGDGTVLGARVFIDGSYEGDLMPLAKVKYTVGREANARYGESENGWQPPISPTVAIDPFVVAGDPASGLLPDISPAPNPLPDIGAADTEVQAYSYRPCVTKVAANAVLFTAPPPDYSAANYVAVTRYLTALAAGRNCNINARGCLLITDVLGIGPGRALPNGKFDVNNDGPISTDLVGMSAAYPDGNAFTRAAIAEKIQNWMQGLLYFLQNAPEAPLGIRREFAGFGLCADEFTDSGHWPHQLYVREARRMVGDYVVTEQDLLRDKPTPDPIAVATYGQDGHDTLHYPVLVSGNPLPVWSIAIEGGVAAALANGVPISYKALVPKPDDATNLLETNALSASHEAYQSIRLEPVYMMLGHAAGAAAVLAVQDGVAVQAVQYAKLLRLLTAEGLVTDMPAILGLANGGRSGDGRRVELSGQFPGQAKEYEHPVSVIASDACCWPSQAAAQYLQCSASATSVAWLNASQIDLVVKYGKPSATPYCRFDIIRHDPAVKSAIVSFPVYASLPPA